MSDDQMLEFMAQISDFMRSTDRRFEQTNQQIDQLITLMHNGFERVNTQMSGLTSQISGLTTHVGGLTTQMSDLTAEVRGTNQRVDRLTDETSAIRRRLDATFDQTGHLTEQTEEAALRISHVEKTQQPTNAELHQRLLAVETKLNQAS